MTAASADIGIFGGSGLYSLLPELVEVEVDTPFGSPSAPLFVGPVGDRRVAFLPRHGTRHEYPPHRVNFRANVWALKEAGVRAILAPFACGSLQPHIHPGDFVVVDQFVDRTWGRHDTYSDGAPVHHASMADPYDDGLRTAIVTAARELDITVHDGGTVVVIQGPRFATRAESRLHRRDGCDVINMTQYPEVALANELGIPYAAVALVTDYDTGLEGVEGIEPVTQEQVFAFFDANIGRVRDLLLAAVPLLPLT